MRSFDFSVIMFRTLRAGSLFLIESTFGDYAGGHQNSAGLLGESEETNWNQTKLFL